MLERREAELREAMKLRHSLTTLLHALRVDMEHVSKARGVLKFKPHQVNNCRWSLHQRDIYQTGRELTGCLLL